jgi:enoyl-CoA hydratase/carnithine racemase
LRAVLGVVREDGSMRAVVLAARGPAFCSGADRSALEGLEGAERARVFAPIALRIAEKIRLAVTEIVASRKPVVAAVNGPAAGGGMMLALACGLRVVSEEARFWMPEITRSGVPSGTRRSRPCSPTSAPR